MLRFAVEQAPPKNVSSYDLIVPQELMVPIDKLGAAFATHDMQRLDRELDHLCGLGLIGFGSPGGIPLGFGTDYAVLTPSPLALHLYVRAQGSKSSPATFWNLKQQPSGGSDSEAS